MADGGDQKRPVLVWIASAVQPCILCEQRELGMGVDYDSEIQCTAGKRLVKVWDKMTDLLALPLFEGVVEESTARHLRYCRTCTLYFKHVSYSVYCM